MVSEIRVYVEGGDISDADTLARFREGFDQFFRSLKECSRKKRISLRFIPCGGRAQAFRNFQKALKANPAAFNVLLVDSEGPVQAPPWQHLRQLDGWQQPRGTRDEQCHLMIQTMEAWLIADVDALRKYYGQGFNDSALPRRPDIEQIARVTLARSLARATQHTQKREYHKIRHGAALLELVDPAAVRRAAPSCERLFTSLAAQLGGCP